MFCVNGVFKGNKLAIHFKLTQDIFVVLYKYLTCAADKTTDGGHSTDCNYINNRIILLMILLITSSSKPLKRDPSREICTYATWLNPSFAKKIPW